jgi:adenylate cyclase
VTAKPDIAAIVDWLIDGAHSASTPDGVLAQLCNRLVDARVPLWRGAVFVRTLHPQILGRKIEWRPGIGATISEAPFGIFDTTAFQGSPVARVYEEVRAIYLRLDKDVARDFPQLEQLRAEGATAYLALPLPFSNGEVHVATWAMRQSGGFSDQQVAALETINAPLARVAEIRALRRTAANLLDTYVGNEAGARILAGHIRRGFSETIRAAIWLSDMRGFTKLADRVPPPALIELLNRYFDCQVPPILSRGGEVLKFMGDGLLAIFPLAAEADPGDVCRAALAAAGEMRSAVSALRDWPISTDTMAPRYGLALHIGELLYGNIGAVNRLDFTCIGPAVNLAARLEGLAAELRRTTVLSAAFARNCGTGIVPLGEFALAGFRAPQTVYGLADEWS